MVFPNLYYKRTAATPKACYICSRPTATVLATIDTADFLYTCPTHLADRGFATRAPDPEPDPKKPAAAAVSAEEIAKVKQEWEEKQRQKKDKEQPAAKKDSTGEEEDHGSETQPGKDAEGAEGRDGEGKKPPATAASTTTPSTPPPPEVPQPSRPTHERYVLHRNIFALRTADHRRRRQAAQTKDLAPRFPGAPNSLP